MNHIDLGKELESAFNAISVLLAFVTVFFGMKYPHIIKILEDDLPMGKPKELKIVRKRLKTFMIFQWLPVIVLTLTSWYILMPLFLKVVAKTSFHPVDFEFLSTALVFVWLLFLSLFVGSIYLAINLCRKIRKCK